jgi:4'-phosphopantetheinyl transferase
VLQAQTQVPDGEAWLAAAERRVLAGLRVPKRRADWRLGRWTAKAAAARWLEGGPGAGLKPHDIEIRAAADGAPEVFLAGAPAPLVLSLSHRAGLALAAVAAPGVLLGCDLELVEPRSAGFVADYLTEAERARLEAAPESEQALLANLFWSAKESAVKALRLGLRVDVREVEVEWEGEALVVRFQDHRFRGRWWRSGEHVLTWVVAPLCPPPHQRARTG